MTTDASSFLMGGGAPSAKFGEIGATVTGTILDKEMRDQTDFTTGKVLTWDDGNVKRQLVVTLQTEQGDGPDDDGARRIYIKGQMQAAIREAVLKAGAQDINPGGTLTVQYYADGEKKGRLNPAKLYRAKYAEPTMPVGDGSDPGPELPF